jgi:hypothetical protein
VVTQWDYKSGINAELKGRLQSVLDWLRPSVILKEKGVLFFSSFPCSKRNFYYTHFKYIKFNIFKNVAMCFTPQKMMFISQNYFGG